MGRLQWNTVTGRYESISPMDSPPDGYIPTGGQYIDTRTGQTKQKSRFGLDIVLANPTPTTTIPYTNSRSQTPSSRTPTSPTTTVAPKAVAPSTTVKPKAGTTPSTTVAPSTTAAPSTTVPAGSTTSTTVPKTGGSGGPSATQVQSGQYVGSPAQVADTNSAVNKAVEEALKGGDYKGAMELIAALSASGSGGGGSSGPSAAETARANTNAYRAAMVAAQQQEAAGQGLQTAYNTQAQSLFDTQSAAIKKYYGDINTQASKTITGAGENFLAQLPQATAYANAQVANLPQAQQGLTEALQAYGATTGKADEQSAQSKAYLDALAKMQASSNQQLQTADTAYMGALRTAGTGANTAAQQALAGNIAGLQAGDMSNVTSAQQALIQKGIEAVLAGQTEAASTRANATATYGVPKKTKPPRKPKK